MTLVKAKFVDNETLNFGDLVGLGCVHGDKRTYPTVNVNVVIEGQAYMMKVGVVDQLSHDFVLGDDSYLTLFSLYPSHVLWLLGLRPKACNPFLTFIQT